MYRQIMMLHSFPHTNLPNGPGGLHRCVVHKTLACFLPWTGYHDQLRLDVQMNETEKWSPVQSKWWKPFSLQLKYLCVCGLLSSCLLTKCSDVCVHGVQTMKCTTTAATRPTQDSRTHPTCFSLFISPFNLLFLVFVCCLMPSYCHDQSLLILKQGIMETTCIKYFLWFSISQWLRVTNGKMIQSGKFRRH